MPVSRTSPSAIQARIATLETRIENIAGALDAWATHHVLLLCGAVAAAAFLAGHLVW